MKVLASIRTAASALLILLAIMAAPAHAAERILIIGVDYAAASDASLKLANPIRDAQSIEKAFDRAGQEHVTLLTEPDEFSFNDTVDEFVGSLSADDVAIVYYAGHAIQYQGENFILLADGKTLVNLNSLVAEINEAARAAVFLIDACRNNPFAGDVQGRGLGLTRDITTRSIDIASVAKADGLAQMSDLRGLSTLMFFATEPGNVAQDGTAGKNSPFAQSLAREIRRRQSLDSLLKRTAVKVNKVTDGKQSPWRQGDIPFDIFLAGMKSMVIP